MGREKVFRFKQFAVVNDRTAMKVGTDGVLIGAWCDVAGARRVLDVGTGCGVIALMVAQRNTTALIDGIDIDGGAIDEATVNFARSPWSDRLKAHLIDFNTAALDEGYDLIVSNPPYFTDSLLPPDAARSLARHTRTLTYRQLIDGAARLLSDHGTVAIITPVESESTIIEASTFASLHIQRLTRVVPVVGALPKRLMWQLSRHDTSYREDQLTIAHRDGAFTDDYIALTKDFYLKM